MTIRDLRQRWPEAERALQVENEILITRDGRPVARLARIASQKPKKKRWNPQEHSRWMKKVYGNKIFVGSDDLLTAHREERQLIPKLAETERQSGPLAKRKP